MLLLTFSVYIEQLPYEYFIHFFRGINYKLTHKKVHVELKLWIIHASYDAVSC